MYVNRNTRTALAAVLALVLFGLLCLPVHGDLAVDTDHEVYFTGETVKATASGVNGSVTFEVVWNNDSLIIEEIEATSGAATLSFKLPPFVIGDIEIFASTANDTASVKITSIKRPEKDDGGDDSLIDVLGGGPLLLLIIVIIVTGALGGLWSVEASRWSMLILMLPLLTKMNKEKSLMDNEMRGAIFGVIVSEPGIHYNEIRRKLKLPNGTAAHHLIILEKEKKIISRYDGPKRRFYQRSVISTAIKGRAGPRPKGVQLEILSMLEEEPGLSQKEMLRKTGQSQQTISYHLKKLQKMGYVDEIVGKVKRYKVHGGPVAFTCSGCSNQFTSDVLPKFCPGCGERLDDDA